MITKVTKENKGLYQSLFQRAGLEYLQDADGISSIDEYFACLKSLAMIDPIYTVLPLDEPVFEIDTNARTITVPSDFKKNGISVQGDEVSEILYFSVDRYTDAMDLFREDINIAIQWETAPDSKGKVIQGISKEYIRDIKTLKSEGKMLFGWAVNSIITQNPGAIRFSVRFYHFDNEQKLDFSLNTLTTSANINPSLNYKFENGEAELGVIDNGNLIRNRLADSVVPDSAGVAAEPEFIRNFPVGFETVDEGETYNSVDLVPVEDGLPEYVFTVQATSEDAGIITYEWYRKPLGSQVEDTLEVSFSYVLTDDVVYSGDYTYYKKETISEGGTSEQVVYKPVAIPQSQIGVDIPEEEVELLYEKVSKYSAKRTGDYRVVAVNRSGLAKSETESVRVRIPGPDGDTFTLETPDGQSQTLLEEGEAILSATGATEQNGDKITYKWYDMADEATVIATAAEVNNSVADTFAVGPVLEEDRATYDKTFKVVVFASRNGDNTEVLEEQFRVTDPAHAPKVGISSEIVKLSEGEVKEISVLPNVSGMVSDELTYQWYKLTKDPDDDDYPIEGGIGASIKLTQTPELATDDVFNLGSGSYYCKVTNHVNGSQATTISDEISVIPY